jgi:glycosyltransferase involved in cell wall biosynthesis
MNVPKVSIGLPVYNGERFLRNAIESILAQNYRDFEFIICDNASTDGTEAICRHYAEKDPRIRYHRNATNIGSSPNHNRTVELARGEYFKWAAHDDECYPELVGRCVQVLERAPRSLVLVYPQSEIIDTEGKVIREYKVSIETKDPRPHRRLAQAVRKVDLGTPMYGLMRKRTLQQTRLMHSLFAPDYVLFAELAMLGEIWEIPAVLLRKRFHPARSVQVNRSAAMRAAWSDPNRKRGILSGTDAIAVEYVRSALRLPLRPVEKLRCMVTGPVELYRRGTGRIERWKKRLGRLIRLRPRQH